MLVVDVEVVGVGSGLLMELCCFGDCGTEREVAQARFSALLACGRRGGTVGE